MNKSDIRKQLLESEMLAHIERYKNSGLSQTKYCRKAELNYARLFYWLKKVRSTKQTA